ncbi:dihydrodipicolinate synthase family protein [Lacipirellula sp.]|uniref:dihydrodipicolinate synthase family protein n=1 Tax=Lacipirellula sp. TaxID=2691419 RepID=UPI003D101FBD
MKVINVADDVRGLWAAIPMPWDAAGRLDEAIFARNVDRLAEARVDGIYTTDADGEFYAVELDEFRQVIAQFARAMQRVDCRAQVGVTWTNTQGIIDRMRVCLDHGINTFHICYPYFMPLNAGDVRRFWNELAEADPAARWIHYNTPRGHVRMLGAEYRALAAEFPEQFIGTKLGTQNYLELSDIIGATPQLSHILTDFTAVPGMLLGGRGTYSFWVNSLPAWQRRLVDLCQRGEWDAASAMQRKFNLWETSCVEQYVRRGYLHGIIGKARAAASGFLEDSGRTRSPYQPLPVVDVERLAVDFRDWWSEELAAERFSGSR